MLTGEEVRLGSMWLMDAMWLTAGVNVPMEYRRSAETVTENLLTYTVIYRIVYIRVPCRLIYATAARPLAYILCSSSLG